MLKPLFFAGLIGISALAIAKPDYSERYIDKVISKLELDDSRAAEVRTIMEAGHAEAKQLMETHRTQMQALRDQQNVQLATILSAEEMEELEKMQKHAKQKMKKHKHDRMHDEAFDE